MTSSAKRLALAAVRKLVLIRMPIAILVVVIASSMVLYSQFSPVGRFKWTVSSVIANPEASVGVNALVDTMEDSVHASALSRLCDDTYEELESRFGKPITYYHEPASLPTQCSVWQRESCFIRLSATSALECDAVLIAVFSGTYETFRNEHPEMRDQESVAYSSPIRFLYR